MRFPRVVLTGGVVASALVLLLAGCGDGGDTGEEATTAAAGGTDLAAFCNAAIEGEALFQAGPELDEEGNPTDEGLAQFSEQLTPLIEDLEANAPEEIAQEVGLLAGGIRQALETGDPSATESPEFFEADAAIDSHVYDNCELENRQEFVAVNYAYNELPETLTAGQLGIRMDNQGEDIHEAVFLRINDDVDMSVEELLQLPEEEAESMAEFKGVAFAGPGQQSAAVMDLEPGRYAVVCFLPVGATSLDDLMGGPAPTPTASPAGEATPAEAGTETAGGEGPPHFTQGMFAEVQVE